MLTILTRDESFHVPLNVLFLREVLARAPAGAKRRLRRLHKLLFLSLVLLPIASRPKAQPFDRIGTRELARAYARELARLFQREPELGLSPPRVVLWALGVRDSELGAGESVDEHRGRRARSGARAGGGHRAREPAPADELATWRVVRLVNPTAHNP